MYYRETLTDAEVLKVLRKGLYEVCPKTAEVRRGGRPLTPYLDDDGRYWIRMYWDGKRRTIARAKLVWMSQTGNRVPPGFQVHHDDLDTRNDAWPNLICLHALDHCKQHAEAMQETLPF